MLKQILSSEVGKTGLLVDTKQIETENLFCDSIFFGKIDNFGFGGGQYLKFESLNYFKESKKKAQNKNNSGLCTYVIFDGDFKIEIAYNNGSLFYLCIEKYLAKPEKAIFVDDGGLFSRFWDRDEESFEIGKLTYCIQSNQLVSIMQRP